MTKTLLASAALLVALAAPCFAADAEQILRDMPVAFSGRQVWLNTGTTFTMKVEFAERKLGKAGEVEFSGMEYLADAKDATHSYKAKVRAVINAQTLAFSMTEVFDSSPSSGNEMFYVGTISPDLRTISATWTSPDANKVAVDLIAAAR